MLGERALHRLAAGTASKTVMSPLSPKSVVGALEERLDVRARQVRVERLAARPALDEREPGRVVGAAVQRVEDAAVLGVRGLDERLEGLEPSASLPGRAVNDPTTTISDMRSLLLGTGRRIVRPARRGGTSR